MTLVICNGMNRSGSTLQYNLARSLIEATGVGENHGVVVAERMQKSPNYETWKSDTTQWHVVKTHYLPPDAEEASANDQLHTIYIYRDIREVAASYKRIWGTEGGDLNAELDAAINNYYRAVNLPKAVLVQQYNHVVGDLPAATREIADFLGIDASDQVINDVAEACSAKKMKQVVEKLESRLKWEKALARPRRWLRRAGLMKRNSKNDPMYNNKRHIDDKTLLLPGHISTNGNPDLPQAEYDAITERYRDWLIETNLLEPT